jgi:vacuolar-type H+-ATPase subunit F/Vma7
MTSKLLVITRPELVPGFQLAGVDAFGAADIDAAQEMIEIWWQTGERGLLAIDDGLLEKFPSDFIKRLEANSNIPYIAIPGGKPLGPEASRRYRIAEMIRRVIGFHITFKGEEKEAWEQ